MKVNYVKVKSFTSTVIPEDGVAYVELRSQRKPLEIEQRSSLQELNQKAQLLLQLRDEEERSTLSLDIYQRSNHWRFYWFDDSDYWGLAWCESIPGRLRWLSNYPKVVITLDENRVSCKDETLQFLVEYLSMLRGKTEVKLTESYRNFVRISLDPIRSYLESESDSLKDARYSLKCRYSFAGYYEEDESLSKIYLSDPPRAFTGSGVHIRPYTTEKKRFTKAVIEEFLEAEDVILVPNDHIVDWPRSGFLEKVPNFSENRRKRVALNHLEEANMIHLQRLLDLLTRPQALPEVDPLDVVNIKEVFLRDSEESKAQCVAIDKAFGSQDICLIQGPPGTGKTEVICEMILQVIRKGGRVLLTSPTNIAVDNVLEKIHEEKGVRPIRIGRLEKISPKLKKYMLNEQEKGWKAILQFSSDIRKTESLNYLQKIQSKFFEEIKKEQKHEIRSIIVDQANFVCGTCIGVVNMEFSEISLEKPFDIMIIDEASKATLLEFLVPAVRARKWVLVGDHRQLAPYVSDIEIKIYLQRFLEKSGLIDSKVKINKLEPEEEISTREYSSQGVFDEKVETIMRHIRRYHEEFHNLEQEYSDIYLERILKVFNHRKRESRNFIEMVEYSLGSCFHFFWKRIDESRKAYLPYQHRMPREIADFLNNEIYDNRFKSSKDAIIHGYRVPLDPEIFSSDPVSPTVFIDTSFHSDWEESRVKSRPWNLTNRLEAHIACLLVEHICNLFPLTRQRKTMKPEFYTEKEPFRIGIITFYVFQARLIRKLLSDFSFLEKTDRWRYKHKEKHIEVRVSVVDRFQGQEQEIIILSLVRSNNYFQPGFLTNIQRMNVGLSRARHNMLIIGNIRFFWDLRGNYKNREGSQIFSDPNRILVALANYYYQNKWVTSVRSSNASTENKSDTNETDDHFKLLIEVLSTGSKAKFSGYTSDWIDKQLKKRNPAWKTQLKVKRLSDYLEAAVKAKIVDINLVQGKKIIKLKERQDQDKLVSVEGGKNQ